MRMLRSIAPTAFALLLFSITASPAAAQDGFALRLGTVFNSSTVEELETDLRLEDAAGWHIGAEYVLPGGLGIGLSGYTAGSASDFDLSEGSLVFLGELNYFFSLPLLPISPYVGAHFGLGTYRFDDIRDGVRPEVDFGDRGYQVGLRFQPTSTLGVDAQYRRVSGSLAGEQSGEFSNNQVLIGITLF